MNETLAQLFRCPAIGKDLAVRACVRRQGESRAIRAANGKLIAWDLVRKECEGCQLGQENARRAGVTPRPCDLCGAGRVGDEPCPGACAARRVQHEEGRVQRGAPPRPPPQDRIWAGEVPDVPIGPPPAAGAPHRKPRPNFNAQNPWVDWEAEEALASRSPAPPAPVDPKPPGSSPAKEDPMACPECKSKTIHKFTCSRRPGGAKPGAKTYDPVTHKPVEKKGGKAKPVVVKPREHVLPADKAKVLRVAARGLAVGPPVPLDTGSLADWFERGKAVFKTAPSVVMAGLTDGQVATLYLEARAELARRSEAHRAAIEQIEKMTAKPAPAQDGAPAAAAAG